MTLQQATALVLSLYPDAKLRRWYKGRYTFCNVQGATIDPIGRVRSWCKPERAWKKLALTLKRVKR